MPSDGPWRLPLQKFKDLPAVREIHADASREQRVARERLIALLEHACYDAWKDKSYDREWRADAARDAAYSIIDVFMSLWDSSWAIAEETNWRPGND